MDSVSTPKEIFEDLSNAQRRFLLEKGISGEKTVKEWLDFLRPIVTYDFLMDNSTRRLKLALRFLSAMAVFNLLVSLLINSLWLGLLGTAMAFLAFYQWTRWMGNKKRDLDNPLRQYFFPLLERLHEDGRSDETMEVEFHLRQKDRAPVIIEASIVRGQQPLQFSMTKDDYVISSAQKHQQMALGTPAEFAQRVRDLLHGTGAQ